MSKVAEKARSHYSYGLTVSNLAVRQARGLWRRVNPRRVEDSFWSDVHTELVASVTDSQWRAASLADDYVRRITGAESVGELNPDPFAGIAADGRELESLLAVPLDHALDALESDAEPSEAVRVGEESLARIVASEVADAGRTADGVAVASRPAVQGYVRVLELPSCPRCVLLAGRVYRWSEGFQRHPGCDCRHVPVTDPENIPDDVTTDPEAAVKAGQVTGLSAADRQAIEDGADVGQVINAVRGTQTAADGTKTTTEGMGRSGFARKRVGKGKPRLRPESIYKQANGNRDEVIRLLRQNGYIL